MRTGTVFQSWMLMAALLLIVSCKKDETPDEPTFSLELPTHFPAAKYDLSKNPITKDGFDLGKKLFYDASLSRTGTISCGSCHQQFAGFVQADHDVSHGVDDLLGTRNALPVVNMLWNTSFFWDGGVFDLDLLSLNPITNPVEMDNSMENVVRTLKDNPDYVARFKKVFPASADINGTNVLKALSQFMGTLVSANSPYDAYVLGNQSALTPLELQGMELFEAHCSKCHQPPLFTDFSFQSNGLPGTTDLGRYNVTLSEADKYKFKVPTLRNIAVTAPYMHTGKVRTLSKVLDHYSTGIADSPETSPLLYRDGKAGFHFTEEEKQALLAFLNALTDQQFLKNPLFSE